MKLKLKFVWRLFLSCERLPWQKTFLFKNGWKLNIFSGHVLLNNEPIKIKSFLSISNSIRRSIIWFYPQHISDYGFPQFYFEYNRISFPISKDTKYCYNLINLIATTVVSDKGNVTLCLRWFMRLRELRYFFQKRIWLYTNINKIIWQSLKTSINSYVISVFPIIINNIRMHIDGEHSYSNITFLLPKRNIYLLIRIYIMRW